MVLVINKLKLFYRSFIGYICHWQLFITGDRCDDVAEKNRIQHRYI